MFWHACRATSFSSLRLIYQRFFFVTESLSFKKNALPSLPSGAVFTRDFFILMCLSYSFHFILIRTLSRHFALHGLINFWAKTPLHDTWEKCYTGINFLRQFIPVDAPDWNSFHGIRKFRSGCSHIVIKIGRVSRKHSFKQNVFINAEYNIVIRGRELRELVTVLYQ